MTVLQDYNPPQTPLDVIYRDDHLLVLSKPPGLLSVPGRGAHLRDSLETRAKTAFPQALLVHRLDCDTSGLMIMAMTAQAQKHLGMQFEKRFSHKEYIAVVSGIVAEDSGHVDLPMICDWPNRPLQKICYEHGKPAQTDWEVIERRPEQNVTVMRLKPRTGRSHQLRVHMQQIGHPILGDGFYAPFAIRDAAPRLMLHAYILGVRHPYSKEDMVFTAPCDFFS